MLLDWRMICSPNDLVGVETKMSQKNRKGALQKISRELGTYCNHRRGYSCAAIPCVGPLSPEEPHLRVKYSARHTQIK